MAYGATSIAILANICHTKASARSLAACIACNARLGYGDGLNHVPEILERQEKELQRALESVSEIRWSLAAFQPPQSVPVTEESKK